VVICGEGDVADICRLSCLEQGVAIVSGGNVPELDIIGLKVFLNLDHIHE
jgi:hypothetical protein